MKLTVNGRLRSAMRVGLCAVMMCLAEMPGELMRAQAVTTTTVQGTVYLANGQPAGGTLVVSWPTFTTAAGQLVASDKTTVTIGTDGFVTVNLAPNLGAAPAGEYYTATFYLSDGTVNTQYWVVPAAAQASLAQVQAQVMPAAQAVQTVSKAYVDQSIAQALGSQLTATGGSLTGPLYLSGDPTQPLQAADKHYVDSSFGNALSLSGGTLTGALGGTSASFSGSMAANASISRVSPVEDIRAYGATINGSTDIGPALSSAIAACNATNGNSCKILLPCGGPNGCYLANGSSLSNPGNQGLVFLLQGNLKLGSTLVYPDNSSVVADGAYTSSQFQYRGPSAVITAPQVAGTIGTAIATTGSAVTFTPTFTQGSASNFEVNSAITVAGIQTCSATASRTSTATVSPNTTFTLSGCTDSSGDAEGPRTPMGSVITITGCSDSSFNATNATVNGQDWPNAIEQVYESGATSTATGCTITGFDDNTYETAWITGAAGGTLTGTFAHKHAASDLYGMVGVAFSPAQYNHHSLQGIAIAGNTGMGLWLDTVAEVNLNGVAVGESPYMASGAVECDGCWQGDWQDPSFKVLGPGPLGCHSSCVQPGYPYAVRCSQDAARSNGIGCSMTPIIGGTIMGGIKVDGNGMANSNGAGVNIGPVIGTTFEQPSLGAITVDPRYSLGGQVSVSANNLLLQDDFIGNTQTYLTGTDCCVPGFGDLGDLSSYGSSSEQPFTNAYWPNSVKAEGVNNAINPASIGMSTGVLTDGNTILSDMRGANAGFSPAVIPYATLPVITSPTCATCSTVTGPDGTADAFQVATTSTGGAVQVLVGSASISTYPGDWIVFGSHVAPGANMTGNAPGSIHGANVLYAVNTTGTDVFSSGGSYVFGGGLMELANDSWQPGFAIAKVVTGEAAAHTISFNLYSPGNIANAGERFYDWFWIDIPGPNNPAYTGVTQAEVVRWAEEMTHGYIPSSAATGYLYMSPAYKVAWGTDSYIYRSAVSSLVTNASFGVGSFASDPSSPANGTLWYNSTANQLKAQINGAAVALGSGGGFTDPMTSLGDVIYGGTSGAATRLAGNSSATTECLTQTGTGSASASPVWGACSGSAATAFSAITGSTNTTAAMVVGTGASLAASGSGTIAATSAPYSGLTGTVPTWNQNTTGTAANVTGVVAIANGGTGSATFGAYSLLFNNTASAAAPSAVALSALPAAQFPTLNQSTTGNAATATSAATATNLSGAAQYSLPYQSASATTSYLSPQATNNDYSLIEHVTASAAVAPTWSNAPALSAANMTSFPTLNQSTTGNAATATNLASYPTLCSSGQFSQGLSSGSNNCATPAGGVATQFQPAATNASIAATNIVASTSAQHEYTVGWTISQTSAGVGCTGTTGIVFNLIFTDPNSSSATTEQVNTSMPSISANGTVGFLASGTDTVLAKTTTAVQYSTVVTQDATCTTKPNYQISGYLVQQW